MRSICVLLLVACRATGASHGAAVTWQAPTELATGGGTKGPWQQNDSNFDYVDDPTVALAADGPVLAWVDHRSKDVFVRSGTTTVNVSRSPDTFSWLPRLALDGDRVYVLWQEIIFSPGGSHGGEILFARSTDGGTTFADPINLSQSTNGDGKGRIDAKRWHNGSLDLAVAPDGTLHAAWTEYDGPLWFASSQDGITWTKHHVAGSNAKPARAPSIAIAPDGTTYLAWTYGEDAGADVQVAVKAGDTFAPRAVATTPTYSDAPTLAVDRAGTLHVAFHETTGGPFDRARVHYTYSRDGKTFAPVTVIADGAFPALAVDDSTIAIAWEVIVDDGLARGLGYAIARDGKRFTGGELVPHSRGDGWNGSHQGHLMDKLALRGNAIAIVNSSLEHGEGSRVWLMRGTLAKK